MRTLDLTRGLGEDEDYKLFRFPGGELHFVLKDKDMLKEPVHIDIRLNLSENIVTLGLVVDTLKKDGCPYIEVFIPYMPYAQADRDFSVGESFTLKAMINRWFNQLPVDKYILFDPHSDVTPALLKNCVVIDNSEYIKEVTRALPENIVWLSPDAGAYKKIFKLAEKIGFKGEVLCCQKDRDTNTGALHVVVPVVPDKHVLIIDDICVGGRTFIEIAKALDLTLEAEGAIGQHKRYLAVSHGIFSNGVDELSKYFTKVFTTNSRKDNYDEYGHNLILTHKII